MTTAVTRLFTLLRGALVGEDEFGNRYYQDRKAPRNGARRRRWVVYKGEDEATKVPPLWHAWLHYTIDRPPLGESTRPLPWQKPHRPNPTGTPEAYRPPGDMLAGEHPEGMPPPYRPWQPQ